MNLALTRFLSQSWLSGTMVQKALHGALVFLIFLDFGTSLKCYVCNNFKNTFQVKCPGSELLDAPDAEACRLLALSDGTVINQSPVTKHLCTMKALLSSKRKIARDFYDGRGVSACCMWDGCNANSTKATKKSLQDYNLYLENITNSKIRAKNPNVNQGAKNEYLTTHRMGQDLEDDFGVLVDANGWSYPKSDKLDDIAETAERASENDKYGLERPIKYEKLEERQFSIQRKSKESSKIKFQNGNSNASTFTLSSLLFLLIVLLLKL